MHSGRRFLASRNIPAYSLGVGDGDESERVEELYYRVEGRILRNGPSNRIGRERQPGMHAFGAQRGVPPMVSFFVLKSCWVDFPPSLQQENGIGVSW